ncbi:prepilin peptidase [Marinihelvus fidelis]|uniref:Prepilin leader peptidase/N-methyltransferase n=1 Tax=Marinihelvus fidelis TaxID=2613842 RepID=A0A5N0T4H2_9GAMM|nr:A24 family peptidase [Marinihelvus fidelis]KAA9129751.1 prepilin peptidase [Marinihelvus fidelis]
MPFESLFPAPLFISGVFVLGLLIGSFLNVVIHRVPARLEHDWRCQCRELLSVQSPGDEPAPPGIVRPGSRCPNCDHAITALENIPVLSFLALRGKCSNCKARISPRYPLVELATAFMFALVAMKFGPTIQTGMALVMTAMLIALAGIDLDHQLLPDSMTLPLLWIGLLASCFGVFTPSIDSILGAVFGYCALWTVFQLFKLLTGKEGMGYGDFKLLAALGAWLGWQQLPLIVLLSSLVGAIIGMTMMGLKKHDGSKPIPFGPFIAIAGWVSLMWGPEIIDAYFHYSGLQR